MADLTVTLTGIRNATFIAKEIFPVLTEYGIGWAAEESACSDFTKVMLLMRIAPGNTQQQLQALRDALDKELSRQQ